MSQGDPEGVVPVLQLPPICSLPPRSLPCEADYLCLLYGNTPPPCKIKKRKAICHEQGGCKDQNNPCILFKIKESWILPGLPIKERDDNIVRMFDKIKARLAAKKKALSSSRLTEQDRLLFCKSLKETTINLAPEEYETKVKSDQALPAARKKKLLEILSDYLGKEGSRYINLPTFLGEPFKN